MDAGWLTLSFTSIVPSGASRRWKRIVVGQLPRRRGAGRSDRVWPDVALGAIPLGLESARSEPVKDKDHVGCDGCGCGRLRALE